MQIPLGNYVVRVRWLVLSVMVVAIWSCIKLGLWQWHKAEQKQEITRALAHDGDVIQPQAQALDSPDKVSALHLQTVTFQGHYLPQFAFFLDNQLEQGQAGFHVITPFLLSDQQHVIWVNRGWLAGFADHQKTPEITTSPAEQVIKGLFWQQKKVGFRLDKPGLAWQPVQPVLDFTYLRQHVPYTFPDVILKLDPAVGDGYLRHWDVPAGQVEKNLSYAYQWFGFAVASLVIGLTQMVEKRA
ncbi:SURF1 family protein [Methylophilus sp. 5]|uniref:SURF1 family protein n=1 Tax=Methylophilus sp. 5 TaxID=1112274 RepID=UPI00048FAE21|nr:SURF1 family protein [Methylophilus sp. 5]